MRRSRAIRSIVSTHQVREDRVEVGSGFRGDAERPVDRGDHRPDALLADRVLAKLGPEPLSTLAVPVVAPPPLLSSTSAILVTARPSAKVSPAARCSRSSRSVTTSDRPRYGAARPPRAYSSGTPWSALSFGTTIAIGSAPGQPVSVITIVSAASFAVACRSETSAGAPAGQAARPEAWVGHESPGGRCTGQGRAGGARTPQRDGDARRLLARGPGDEVGRHADGRGPVDAEALDDPLDRNAPGLRRGSRVEGVSAGQVVSERGFEPLRPAKGTRPSR